MSWKKAAGLYVAYKIGQGSGARGEPEARAPMPRASNESTSHTANAIVYGIFAVIGFIAGIVIGIKTR